MGSKISVSLIGGGSMLQLCIRIVEENPQMELQRVFIKDDPIGYGHKLANFLAKRNINSTIYRDLSDSINSLTKLDNQDLLVSVYNDTKLDPDFLVHFAYAINFHDSPLPRYAGVNAVSWALLAGESSHGATWHEITERFDAGDIVAQEIFAVDPQWTALDLATRSIEVGCALFHKFLNNFARGKVVGKKQDLENRSYFGRKSVPFGGLFPFLAPIELVEKLRRATAYYPMPNRFCTPLVTVGDTKIGLSRFRVCAIPSGKEPGTVVGIDESGIHFSTIDGTMTAEILQISRGNHVRSLDPETSNLLKIGSSVFVDTTTYNKLGLL